MQQNSDYIRLAADLTTDSIVDGPGLRAVVWTQGCSHNCKGCQNPGTHDFNGGGLVPVDMVCEAISELKYHTGITFSGGDPMFQPEQCAKIAAYAKSLGFNVWVYTGFTFEELIEMSKKNPAYDKFIHYIDVLVDGKFILEQKDLNLLFRGSSNQRLIDIPKTLSSGKITLLNEYEYKEEKIFEKEPMFV